MPGMMDTILNLGLNEELADGLGRAVGDPSFAADCLSRFRDGYRAVIGVDDVPDDPWDQLRRAIQAVFRSWNSDRAQAYREREGIPDDLGTAVTVQAMVFGNRGADSGTGVLFTRNPSTGENELYGDVMFNAQGEDVVAGTHATQPISALDTRLPLVAAELRARCGHPRATPDRFGGHRIHDRGRPPVAAAGAGRQAQPARGTADGDRDGQRRVLPTDAKAGRGTRCKPAAEPPRVFVRDGDVPLAIAIGLPASPGVATGAIVTSSEAAETAAESGQTVILVRSETSPEDVRGMARSAGVLTAHGGLASHAAVVARGWGIPAVVGVAGLIPSEAGVDIDGQWLDVGRAITIDGGSGEVFAGELAGHWEVAPEAATLLAWASELGMDVAPDSADALNTEQTRPDPGSGSPLASDDVVRLLLIRGSASVAQLSDALLATADDVQPIVDELVSGGRAEVAGDQVHPTAQVKIRGAAAFEAERGAAGLDSAQSGAMLEQFHAFDARMKDLVTAWQVRDVAGEQVLNDHTDLDYDRRLTGDLNALHSEVAEWLDPLASRLRAFSAYRTRLAHALELARAGDQRYVASPRVDSYHTVWFELHEHLIRLAGRKRTDEAAAGRA